MAWKTPKTDWAANDVPGPNDFNRIEGNTLDNHERLNGHLSDGTQHAKTVRFVIGTSTAGWTAADCDYLCDGTNDQVEINNAINALPATGGEVVILDGTYNITNRIYVNKDNVSIRGSGNATILKRMWNSSSGEGVITLSSVEGCRVENLQIDGNKAIYGSSYNYGIHLALSGNNTITGNTCNNNSYGINLYSCSNNTITGNTCNNNNNNCGIYLATSSNNTITGNTCNNNNCGIRLDSSSNNNMVIGNTCNNNSIGIHLPSSSNNTITGNTCNNNSNYGIILYSSSNNIVTGNTYNNNNNGIYLSSSSNNNTITGNTCNNNNYSIHLYLSSNNTITGNTCNNNNSGIRLSSSSNNTVTGNTCTRGIGTPEDYSTDQHTIVLAGTANNYNLITSNNCMGKAAVISGGAGNSVFNNKWDASDDIQNIHERLNGHDSDIANHNSRISANESNIASINSTLSSHNSRISSNTNRLDNIEDGSSLALGENASAGNSAVALGWGASAGDFSLALGRETSAESSSVALGNGASVRYYSVALGRATSATGDYSVALGYGALAAGNSSTALGHIASAAGLSSVALGYNTTATGESSLALGYNASAAGNYSIALGLGTLANNANEGILGGTGSSSTSRWIIPGDFTVNGGKNFEIPHPKPEKKATHVIRHGAVESPTPGDTLYRWKVQATKDNDLVTIDLPDYFVWLNKDVQIWVTGQGHFGNGYGTLNRETEQLEIHCQLAGEYNVLVIGTRNDDHPSVQNWSIKGVEREIGESWTGETYAFSVDEILEVEEIKEVS